MKKMSKELKELLETVVTGNNDLWQETIDAVEKILEGGYEGHNEDVECLKGIETGFELEKVLSQGKWYWQEKEDEMKNNIKIINCTPHDVNLITENGNITFPKSGIIPRLTESQQKINSVAVNGIEIDIMEKSFLEPEGLPEPQEGTIFIVSALVAGAVKGRDDLVVPNDTVRDEEGRIIGCRSLARI